MTTVFHGPRAVSYPYFLFAPVSLFPLFFFRSMFLFLFLTGCSAPSILGFFLG